MKFWCKSLEDGDNVITCRRKVTKGVHRMYNCAFVGVTKVSIEHTYVAGTVLSLQT